MLMDFLTLYGLFLRRTVHLCFMLDNYSTPGVTGNSVAGIISRAGIPRRNFLGNSALVYGAGRAGAQTLQPQTIDNIYSTPSVILEGFKFHSYVHRQEATFVAELRKLLQHCEFGDSQDCMLRDRLVCGINQPSMQRRLLAEVALTFKKALEIHKHLSRLRRIHDIQLVHSIY